MFNVHAPGSKVTIGEGITGEVVTVRIMDGGYVDYQVAWWNKGARSLMTMEAFELNGTEDKIEIGFHANGKGEETDGT